MTGELTVTPGFVWPLPAHTDKPPQSKLLDRAVAFALKAAAYPVAQTGWSALYFISVQKC